MPNDKILKEKQDIVNQMIERFNGSAAGVLVDYRGLTVEQDTNLRNKLREAGVEYTVIKNTMARFAIGKCGLEELDSILHGPTSLATHSSDLVAPAKILSEFAKTNDKLEIKSGFVEGAVISVDEVKQLATLPSREELVAQVLRGFNAPIAGFANVLNANLSGLARVLGAIAEQKSA